MNADEFENMSDSDLLRRIYAAQVCMMADIEKINKNVAAIRRKVEPEAFELEQINKSGDNPTGFIHLTVVNEMLDESFHTLLNHLDKDRK